MSPPLTTRSLTEEIQRLVTAHGKTEGPEPTSAASGDFQDGCDHYEAFSIVLWAENGREFYVTIEDVTLKKEPEDEPEEES